MEVAKTSIAKQPWQWVENDILSLITNKVRENINLDYKATASLKKTDKARIDISKDVSAFANSAGGTIVYGVMENNRHEPEGIDGGYDPSDISGEWLEQVINSTIQPRVQNIRINQVDLPTQTPGHVLYVVHIPQSLTAHQAIDKRYYKRYNFQSVPMEDWEIKDILNRGTQPDLSLLFKLERVPCVLEFKEGEELSEPVSVRVQMKNDGRGVAEYSVIHLFIPREIEFTIPDFKPYGEQAGLNRLSLNMFPPNFMPVFKITGTWNIRTGTLRLSKSYAQGTHVFLISWRIEAPQMDTKDGTAMLLAKDGTLIIAEGETRKEG